MSVDSVRVAVVTGANRGIGLAIVEKLAESFEGIIYLTARDRNRGEDALHDLKQRVNSQQAREIRFHQLDLTDKRSVTKLRQHLLAEHKGLDILINNAGIAYKTDDPTDFSEQARITINVNYFGTLDVCRELVTIIRPHGRVVNISSRAGNLSIIKDAKLRERLCSPSLSVLELTAYVETFVGAARYGQHEEIGFPSNAYFVSKLAVTLLSFCLQRMIDRDHRNEDITVNACSPGYVKTEMTSFKGNISPPEGADTPVFLALLTNYLTDGYRGRFVYERKGLTFEEWTAMSNDSILNEHSGN